MLSWGIVYVPSAWLVDRWPPLTAAGARVALGGLLLLGALALAGRPLRPRIGGAALAGVALTQTALFYGATFWGIAHAGAGLAAVLANTDALFVAILAAAFLGERLERRQWAGIAVGLAGAAIVVWRGPLWPPALAGDALVVVGGALAWGLGTVIVSRGMRGRRADPLALAGWQMLVGGAALALVGALAEEGRPSAGAGALGLVALTAVVGAALPLALFYSALARAPAAEVSAWFLLVPAVGVLSAWPLLGEQPGARLAVGLAAVLAGLWLVVGRGRPEGRLVDSAAPP